MIQIPNSTGIKGITNAIGVLRFYEGLASVLELIPHHRSALLIQFYVQEKLIHIKRSKRKNVSLN